MFCGFLFVLMWLGVNSVVVIVCLVLCVCWHLCVWRLLLLFIYVDEALICFVCGCLLVVWCG